MPLPPVQLPVSGRTLGRHVSLGPGWELNKDGAAAGPGPRPPDYDQPSSSQQAVPHTEVSIDDGAACSFHAGHGQQQALFDMHRVCRLAACDS